MSLIRQKWVSSNRNPGPARSAFSPRPKGVRGACTLSKLSTKQPPFVNQCRIRKLVPIASFDAVESVTVTKQITGGPPIGTDSITGFRRAIANSLKIDIV